MARISIGSRSEGPTFPQGTSLTSIDAFDPGSTDSVVESTLTFDPESSPCDSSTIAIVSSLSARSVTSIVVSDSIHWDTDFPRAYYSFDALGTTNDINGDGDFTGETAGDGAFLKPGNALLVHFEFVGRESELDGDRDDIPEVIGIYAEARS